MKSLGRRVLAVTAISFVIALTSGCAGPAQSPGLGGKGPAEVGKLAPRLTIQPLNGKGAISLSSLTGKIAVVDFWATWCAPCKASLPKLEALAKQNPGKVEVVGISVDDTRDGVADFAKAQGASFPIGWDENRTLARRWSVEKMPTTYLLDATGTVRFVHEAYKDDGDAIARELAQLVSELAASNAAKVEVATAPQTSAAAPSIEPTPEPVTEVIPRGEQRSPDSAKATKKPTKKATTKKKNSAAPPAARGL